MITPLSNNEYITLVKSDGTSAGYSNAISDGYRYTISIM